MSILGLVPRTHGAADLIRADGSAVEHVKINGGRGHLDGVLAIGQAAGPITQFLAK